MPGPVFLQGELVELRTMEPEDADALQRVVNDPRVRRGVLLTDPVSGPAEREWIESVHEDDDAVHLATCVDGDVVGTIGYEVREDGYQTAEVGYMLHPDHWGNGYATDALGTLCRHAFEERGLAKVVGRAYETNPASRRVMEKVGFVEEGVLRAELFVDGERVDVHRYGLLREEWFDE